jgi:orotate phosphoribosyltransferase
VEALRNNGCKVLGIVAIFDYEFPTTQRKLEKLGVDLTALTNLDTVLHHASYMGVIDDEEQQAIKEWQVKPTKWNK